MPLNLSLHLLSVQTSKGDWIVDVRSFELSENGELAYVKIILEQTLDAERVRMRKLDLQAPNSGGWTPVALQKISDWIDGTEGDGFVDCTIGSRD